MKLNEKMEELLKDAHIDFSEFTLVEALPVNKSAVVLLAPKRNSATARYFNRQYNGTSNWFGSMESMLDSCVECGMFSQKTADKILRDYNR